MLALLKLAVIVGPGILAVCITHDGARILTGTALAVQFLVLLMLGLQQNEERR